MQPGLLTGTLMAKQPEYEVQTEVVAEHGQWTVYLLLLTPQGIDRRRLETYFTEAKARLAADVITRTAARRRPPR